MKGDALVCNFNLPIGIKFGKHMYYKTKSGHIRTHFHIAILTNFFYYKIRKNAALQYQTDILSLGVAKL